MYVKGIVFDDQLFFIFLIEEELQHYTFQNYALSSILQLFISLRFSAHGTFQNVC